MYIAIDQYGNLTYLDKYPRKELCELLDNKHVSRMYIDKKDGSVWHIGYVIGHRWLRVYGLEGDVFQKQV